MQTIITKYLEGRASEAEMKELLGWLRNKENRLIFQSVQLDWKSSLVKTGFPAESRESWLQLQEKLAQKKIIRLSEFQNKQFFLRIAAIFIFAVSLAVSTWFVSQKFQPGNEVFTRVVAGSGQISKVELPDGTEVWLNSGSAISYGSRFSTRNRNIELQGEAFFQAARNEKLPLVVTAGELKVKVLGTTFNVNAYPETGSVDVVLEEGSVEIVNAGGKSFRYLLKPGELARFDRNNRQMLISEINPAKFTAWKDGIINIYDQTMEELVKRLENRYNQKFEISDDVKHFRYTFTITNEPLDEIIRLMEKITPVIAEQTDEVIVFRANKKKIKTAVKY
jgi:ferric-dicitrate binding protein FerR (iron transport regulator)